MIATKLIVNRKPSLSAEKRSQVRSQVYQLERAEEDGTETVSVDALAIKASQRVGQLGRFHVTQAADLRERVKTDYDTDYPSNLMLLSQCPLSHRPRRHLEI